MSNSHLFAGCPRSCRTVREAMQGCRVQMRSMNIMRIGIAAVGKKVQLSVACSLARSTACGAPQGPNRGIGFGSWCHTFLVLLADASAGPKSVQYCPSLPPKPYMRVFVTTLYKFLRPLTNILPRPPPPVKIQCDNACARHAYAPRITPYSTIKTGTRSKEYWLALPSKLGCRS